MPRFSANLSIMFLELPFLERFEAAKAAGFKGVECWFPYDVPVDYLRDHLKKLDLVMVGINSPNGGPDDWGLAALPGREDEFLRSVEQAIAYADGLGGSSVHVMAGITNGYDREQALRTYYENLERAIRRGEGSRAKFLIEPLNQRDRPGYALSTAGHAADIVDRFGPENLKIMFDFYHVHIQEGDALMKMGQHWDKIGHIQIAGVPLRGAPDTGDLDFVPVFAEIDRRSWGGWVGAEYQCEGDTLGTLGWFARHKSAQAA